MNYLDILSGNPAVGEIARDIHDGIQDIITELDITSSGPVPGIDLDVSFHSGISSGNAPLEKVVLGARTDEATVSLLGLSTVTLGGNKPIRKAHGFRSMEDDGDYQLGLTGHNMVKISLDRQGLRDSYDDTDEPFGESVEHSYRRVANLGQESRSRLEAVIRGIREGIDAVELIRDGHTAAEVLEMMGRVPLVDPRP